MKHFKSIFLLITLGFAMWALLVVAISPAYAACTATSQLIPLNLQNSTFVIAGLFDQQNATFSGTLRLSNTGGAISDLKFLPSDLNSTDITPPAIIDSSNVTMTGATSFKNGDIQDERITVMNVIHPGTYTGDLRFLIPGQTVNDALDVPLKLQISMDPNIQAPTVSIKAVHEQIVIDKGLITWLIPDSADNNNWIILLTNQGPLPVTAIHPRVVLTGVRTGVILTNDQITLKLQDDSINLPPHQTRSIPLTIKPDMLPPDYYTGTILFQFDGSDKTLSVNMDLNVRYGPFWPLIVILLGIVFGRLAVNMKTWFATKQLDLLPQYYQLNYKIAELISLKDDIIDDPVIKSLTTDLEHLHDRIESSDAADTEESVTQDIQQLENRVQFFVNLRNLEESVLTTNPPLEEATKDGLITQIVNARNLGLDREKEQEAQDAFQTAQDAYYEALQQSKAKVTVRAIITSLPGTASQKTASGWRKASRGAAHILAFLSGSRVPLAELRYWVARPLLALLLLVLLVLLGLQTLYVNSAMFGAAGVFDYLSLLLWGFGSDITQSTLLGLKIGGN